MTSTLIDPDLVAAVLDLRQGDHLCLVYDEDPAEQLPAILPFLRQGLNNGEQCVYVADDHTLEDFRQALQAYGVDVEAAERSGALLLWTRDEWRQPGDLDSARKAEQVQGVVDRALAAGFKGIRFGVEMTWTLGPDIDAEKLRHWEATINTIFTPETPGRIICQYSRKRLAPEVVQAGIATHPVAVLGNEIYPNPFYEAPLILEGRSYAAPNPAPEHIDWLLSQVRWARAYEREREQRLQAEAVAAQAEATMQVLSELQAVTLRLQESEADLDDFFENGVVPLHWVGPDGTILRANRAELAMLGYEPSDYVGRDIREFHADRAVIEDILARLTRGEVLHEYESQLIARDGSLRDVVIDSSVLWRDGEFVHTRCFTRDITDRNKTDLASTRLAAIVDSSDDAIASKDLDGTVTSWNKAAEHMFGYRSDEIVGRNIRTIIPNDRQSEEDEVLRRIRAGERVDHFETVRQRKDGSLIDISLSVSPVKDGRGRVIGAAKIARDITERKAGEKAIEESMAMKDQFLSLVSHELRTPIATILGNGQLLLRRADLLAPEDKQQALMDVVSETERLQRIIENLLMLTRMDSGRELRPEPVQLTRLVDGLAIAFRHRTPGRSLIIHAQGDVPIALGEPSLITLVVENLLSNAQKYSPADATIELVLYRDDGGCAGVRVQDRGIGFHPEELPELFTAFYRSRDAARTAGGMGLGLAVCKRIVEEQGGNIGARLRQGGGSEFFFSLPSA